jgi:signal transduction histidine kinase
LLFTLTLVSAAAAGALLATTQVTAGFLLVLVTLTLLSHTTGFINKFFRDVRHFAEAARYRDFSKRYPERTGRKRNDFYRYFNEISNVFRALSREKEVQQQYLLKMLELIDTGILAYDRETNDVLWLNEAFRSMFGVPAIKNIRWLKTRRETLYRTLRDLPLGQHRLMTTTVHNQQVKTMVNAHAFQTSGKTYRLIAFHNIGATMEEIEANAWKGLLSVMTHEIMNSIAPVASLADTLKKRMERRFNDRTGAGTPEFDDMVLALDTIYRRSEGLLRFADNYRNLSKTIVPDIRPTHVQEMLWAIEQLMQPSLQQKNIRFEVNAEPTLPAVPIDRTLMEQVLINLITNATYAVREKAAPHIALFAGITTAGNPYITVADNGCGIAQEVRDKIFIPFFSTKKNGTGIGLSLSREIVKLHKGRLQVQSREGEGSAFTVWLNKEV